jgi:tetratricopeptide (TPR) repeat protein
MPMIAKTVRPMMLGLAAFLAAPLLSSPSNTALTALFGAAPAYAQDDKPAEPTATKQRQTLSKKVYDDLTAAQAAFDAKNRQEAIRLVQGILADTKINPYERALSLQQLGFFYADAEDYTNAARYFEQALASGGLEPAAAQPLLFNLGQIYLQAERYQDALKKFEEWFKVAQNPNGNAYYMLAVTYAQLDRFRDALSPIKRAIEMDPEPRESWYQLYLASLFELKDYKAAEGVLETVVQKWPKNKTYWLQLGAIAQELNNDDRAFALAEMAYYQGFYQTSDEIERIAQLHIANQNPAKGARVLEAEMGRGKVEKSSKNYELLANAYFNARDYEKSIAPLTQAAASAGNGDLYVRLGESYLELREPNKAREAVLKGIEKGKLTNGGRANLILGMAYHDLKNDSAALAAFQRAANDSRVGADARRWVDYLQKAMAADKQAEAAMAEAQKAAERAEEEFRRALGGGREEEPAAEGAAPAAAEPAAEAAPAATANP